MQLQIRRTRRREWKFFALAAMALVSSAGATRLLADSTERASVSSAEVQDNTGVSSAAYVTPNGRWVVFSSGANDLVSGDTNNTGDVFVRDRLLGTTARVSLPDPGTGNAQANRDCRLGRPGVRYCSDNGRFVVFVSAANNLVLNDTNGDQPPFHIDGLDIFVRDRDLDNDGIYDEAGVGNVKTVRVSVTSGESQYTEFSIGLDTYAGGVDNPSISASGRYVAFESQADNLNSGENGTVGANIYWRDRDADNDGIFDESGGSPDAAITRLVSKINGSDPDGFCSEPAISGDGLQVAFVTASERLDYDTVFDNDSNSLSDVYVRKMSTANTNKSQRISLDSNEAQNTSGGSFSPSISFDGRYVAFQSSTSQLLPNGEDTNAVTDVFVRDRGSGPGGDYILSFGSTERASLGSSLFGSFELSAASTAPFISSTGRYVTFLTTSSVLCGIGCAPTGGFQHVYTRDRLSDFSRLLSQTNADTFPNGNSSFAAVSNDASVSSFVSVATDAVTPDANGAGADVYVRVLDLTAGSWNSIRTHSGAGALSILLNQALTGNGANGPIVESRNGGIQRIEMSFSTPVTLVSPSVSVTGRTTTNGVLGGPVDYSGAATVSLVDSDTMAITFSPGALPDQTCYTINITGAVSNAAGPLTGDVDCMVRSLVGDTTDSGTVNLSDALFTKTKIGQNATSVVSHDVNLSGGTISLADALFVKGLVTSPAHQALCP